MILKKLFYLINNMKKKIYEKNDIQEINIMILINKFNKGISYYNWI